MSSHSIGEEAPIEVVTPDETDLEGLTEEEKEKQRLIWQKELAKVEEEIQTLRHVLQSKLRTSQELKRKLGISVWRELTDDLSQGVRNVKESNVYQNVEEKITHLGKVVADAPIYQKTESVVKATAESTRTLLGGLTGGFTHKIGQLKNSESFRSLEEKVGSAYENVKTKVSSSRSSSMQSFDEALREETAKRANATNPTSPTIPEGKPIS